ncbi:PKD domain-containing protein [Chitinophagaceae bacterium LB-8]|uniref:PKD domain-containing protein n=1 Tax=Paraflavisolibacter caeni TaxID=2982496 RepID=A0A9X2XYF2_9BACT|nr:PKD domain-containing protein [Paraflavisolibacter caeni]MCU7551050.1 PKD domain-containing protein [Paraflavisolibacter caeni]
MLRIFILLIFLLPCLGANASHIVGGEMIYEYVGAGSTAGTKKYRITLRLFRDQHCVPPCAGMPPNVFIGIFNNDDNRQYPSDGRYFDILKTSEVEVPVGNTPPCVVNPPVLEYHIAEYIFTVDLPENNNGYTAVYQTCCRVNGLTNVFNIPSQGDGTGSTYACSIPGKNQLPSGQNNSSPKFFIGVSPICHGKPFQLDFRADEPDGTDELVYSFCEAYNGGATRSATNVNPAPPPYGSVPYINGFNSSSPMGPTVIIDPKTGLISGVAPEEGDYVICVCISEYRQGKLIGVHRKDFIVNVEDCDFAGAQLRPSYSYCKSLSASFLNENNSPLNKTYFWDFGDGTSSTNISATHTYASAGTYNVKLVINRGEPCGDSATTKVNVYPFFNPNMEIQGQCLNRPTTFLDKTTTTYGTVNAWEWDFGDLNTTNDVSTQQNPTYTFTQTGPKNIRLIASNSNGCTDTTYKTVDIYDKPLIGLKFRDTLICNGDQLQLVASGTGNFSWTSTANISNANTATPTVKPAVTASFVVTLDDDGCVNTDSVQVRVVDFVSLRGMADTTICATDRVQLSAVTDGLRFQWSPVDNISNPSALSPWAAPSVSTTYQLTAFIGRCSATDNVVVNVVPYPVANAGPDTVICFNSFAQLQGSIIGKTFNWSPQVLLTDATTLRPVARPMRSTPFVLTAFDDQGCPKPGRDTVLVTVLPEVVAYAGGDTAVVVGQKVQLKATGGVDYSWNPATALSNPKIPDPVALYDGSLESIRYQVVVRDATGCTDTAYVQVRIFQTDPRIFVPSAFTPNGDNINDVFRPIAVGMSRIEFFRVFNRWGELVFSTNENGKGWDGRIDGQYQASGTYVWVVKGVDYTGKDFSAKGTVTLIR